MNKHGEWKISSIKGAEKTGYLHAEELSWTLNLTSLKQQQQIAGCQGSICTGL